MKTLGSIFAALCALLLSATTASAATISTDALHPDTVYIRAAPGEANAITAWASISGLAISDSYAFTLPSSGCFVPSLGVPSRVICPGFTHLVVHLGDGNDMFRLSGPAFTSSVWGGTGIDEEWGGAGHDHLRGEIVHGRLGNDVLHATQVAYGGPGNDRCIAPVRVGCER